jgi:membrane protease YdiL (CAAX protease family)
MSRAAVAGGSAKLADSGNAAAAATYLSRSTRPLTSLVFLLPFIILYELGTRLLLTDPVQGTHHIVAFTLLQRFFALFGATGRHLPALAVVSILIAWHVARKDNWTVSLPTLLGMAAESIALGLPLIVFGVGLARLFPALSASTGAGLPRTVILSLGAGVYEEVVFRLILCTALAMVLRNGLRLNPRLSMLLLVLLSATLFSAYHYLGSETFYWRIFVFRMAAGVYFAAIFVFRGFGLTAGGHISYDLMVALLPFA